MNTKKYFETRVNELNRELDALPAEGLEAQVRINEEINLLETKIEMLEKVENNLKSVTVGFAFTQSKNYNSAKGSLEVSYDFVAEDDRAMITEYLQDMVKEGVRKQLTNVFKEEVKK